MKSTMIVLTMTQTISYVLDLLADIQLLAMQAIMTFYIIYLGILMIGSIHMNVVKVICCRKLKTVLRRPILKLT